MNSGKRLKTKKSMRQICQKCGYENCVPKLYIDNFKYPSGSILRCKSLFSLKNGGWIFGRNGNELTGIAKSLIQRKQLINQKKFIRKRVIKRLKHSSGFLKKNIGASNQAQAEGIAEAKKREKHLRRPRINLDTFVPGQMD
ncbi:hypothetical protein EL84_00295 [Paenibacillus sp. VT-400]|nr:hypothetical protein EL84_00295 [Paenibacillus sp. VT-400]